MTLGWFEGQDQQLGTSGHFIRGLLTLTPVMFLAFVGAYSRGYIDRHVVPAGTASQDDQALAYAPYVRATQKLFASGHGQIDRAKLLSLAKSWDKASQEDKLQPLLPVSFEDSPEDGARGGILTSNSALVAALIDDATDQAHKGNVSQAADEALLAARLSESLKFSDFHTVFLESVQQERAIDLLNHISGQMDSQTKANVRANLHQLASDTEDLQALTRISRRQYYDYLARMSEQPVTIEDVHRTVLVTKRIASDPTSRITMQFVRSTVMSDSSDAGPEYLSELRLAWAAHASDRASITRTMQTLSAQRRPG